MQTKLTTNSFNHFMKAVHLIDHKILVEFRSSCIKLGDWLPYWLTTTDKASWWLLLRVQKCSLWSIPRNQTCTLVIFTNDERLVVTNPDLWKFVDDTTGSEIIGKEAISQANMAVNEIYDWSINHKIQLNQERCKEMQICFSNNRNLEEIPCIIVNRRISTTV